MPKQEGVGSTSLKTLTLEQLGDIEVTAASKEPEEVWHTPAAIYVITQEDIRRSGATSLPEILRRVPGLEVGRIDSSTWAVGIRGFGSAFSKSVLVLIDGRNVYTPLFAGVNWKLQHLLFEDIDRIEVIRGPGGTVWGTNAVNGVIDIITKNSKKSSGTVVSVGGGNVDEGFGGFRYGGNLGRSINYRAYGMALGRGPEFHADRDNFDNWQFGQAGFRLDWDSQRANTVTVQGDLYKGEIGERESIAYYSPPASINVDSPEDVSGGNLLAQWRHTLPGGSDFRIQAYYDRTYRLGSQLGETRNTFDVDFIHHFTSVPRQDIIWGVGARWSPSDVIQTVATVDFEPHHQSDNIYSAFLQDEFAIVRGNLALTVGSKFEHNIYTGWETQPNARLTWTPGVNQTLWAAVTRAVRSPSRIDEDVQLTQLFTTVPLLVYLRIVGNPNFVSETLLGYELGYRKLLTARLYADVAFFHNDQNHLTSFGSPVLSVESTPPPLREVATVPWVNGIKGNTDGAEISPDWRPTDWLEFKASYSYLNLHLKNKPGNTDMATIQSDEGSSPRHQLMLQSLVNLPKGFQFDPAYRYVSALPAQYSSNQPTDFVKAYNSMDVRIGCRHPKDFDLSIVGQDLFQPDHAEFGGDPGPLVRIKRSIYAQLKWTR
jgi:iron complex outermembrane receptor protein